MTTFVTTRPRARKDRTYTPNSERMTLEEFFGVTGDMPSKEKEA